VCVVDESLRSKIGVKWRCNPRVDAPHQLLPKMPAFLATGWLARPTLPQQTPPF